MWYGKRDDKGYSRNPIFKRRREIPDINSRNFNVRGFAERTAINSPIQGSAADILKIAMIHLDQALERGAYKTKMLLQVHDEIVLQVPSDELAAIKELVKRDYGNPLLNLRYHWKPMKTKAKHGIEAKIRLSLSKRKR